MNVRGVFCPYCAAPAGLRCISSTGCPTGNHRARVDACREIERLKAFNRAARKAGIFKTAARIARICVLVLSIAWISPGCGSIDDEMPIIDAPAKCAALRAVFCARVVACDPSGVTQAQCEQAFGSSLDCGAAVGVGASYDRCIADLPTWNCATFDHGRNPPASCSGAIKVSQ